MTLCYVPHRRNVAPGGGGILKPTGDASGVSPTPRGVLRHYWKVADARAWHFALPIFLILAGSAFEAASLSLLLPLEDVVADNSFAVLDGSRWFGWIRDLVPPSLRGTSSGDGFLVVVMVGLIIVGRVAKLVIEYGRKLFVVPRNERYRVRVTEETFGRVMAFGRQYFDKHAVGRVDAEIGWSSSVIGLVVAAEELFRYAVGLAVKASIMVALSLPLSIAFLLSLPFVNWFVHAINRAVTKVSAEGVEVDRRLRGRVLDLLGSIPLVKAYSQESAASNAYAEILHEAESVAVRRDRIASLRYPIEEVFILFVMLIVQGVVIWYTSDEFQPSDLTTFAVFLLLLQQALPDYKYLSLFSLKVSEELPRLEALAGLFKNEDKFIVPSGDKSFTGLRREISVHDLDFSYQAGTPTLSSISTTIPAGGVTAIVGRSGVGKTTFVDLIARFYDCEPGAILLDDVDIREYSLASLHERMAIVSQDVWLLNRSVRENLVFGLGRLAPDDELFGALRDVELEDFVSGLASGLDTAVGDRGVRLSGGQRQRLALARALLRDPEILILDEATSALDSVVEQKVAAAIARRVEGHTLIVIAHRLSTIRDADRILVLDDGRLVEEGGWDELLARGGAFAELHSAQFEAAKPAS